MFKELYTLGEEAIKASHAASEKEKVGGLRGGSAGILLHGDTPVGTCARKAYLRFKGIDLDDIAPNRSLMFQAGNGNEDIWEDVISAGLKASGSTLRILREEDIPVAWELANGTAVTGRPDMILLEGNTPKAGLELKLVSSLWTAKDLLVYKQPKLPHLIQAGHYLKCFQVGKFKIKEGDGFVQGKPTADMKFEIHYTSRTDFAISGESWMQRLFKDAPKDLLEWRENKEGHLNPIKVLPFRMGFEIMWSPKGQLLWRHIGGDGKWSYTQITWDSIHGFFNEVATVDEQGVLPNRPLNIDAAGDKASWSLCDVKYCVLSATCDKHENSLGKWKAAVNKLAQERADGKK